MPITYQYTCVNYPSTEDLNALGVLGWKIYHVRSDSGGVPYFVYLMREIVTPPNE